jgi:glycerophosphoryl diester phosphodiesterase
MPDLKRVGHKGADLIAPGNTPASFDAALAAGVDMIEFDVLPVSAQQAATCPLVLAHDYTHDLTRVPSMDAGLDHLAGPAFAGVELDVDMKLPGYEDRVVAALQARGLVERTLVSSMFVESLDRIRALEPGLRLGWSIPKVKRNYLANPLTRIPAAAALVYGRAVAPGRVAQALRSGRVDAVMALHLLVTPRLVRAVRESGGELYAWTVDDAARIGALERLGVTGVITNDPRLFGQRMVQVPAL